ncbi:peptidylprolyl isomerase [Marinilabiliaceae bacterium JC017]|nr:peptidylprolyl isomerase [Marinilabiliaceae bacterium JC017]
MQKLFVFSFYLLFSLSLTAQTNVIDEVIAVVGDNAILKSDIEHRYEQALSEGATFPGDMKCYLFEEILIQSLMINQAALDSIEVNHNQVVNQVDGRINYIIQQLGDKDKMEEYFNKSMLQIKRDMMEMVQKQMLADQMKMEITQNLAVTPSEIKAYYRRLPQDSLPMVPTQYELQQIVVYPKVEQEEIDRVKKQLRGFQREINEGRDFATLAVLYSEDPGSASRGGDLGWATRASYVPEFANVAFNLQDKNKVSKIVETEFGFHIIQLIDRKGDRINVRHILIRPKISQNAREESQNRLDTIAKLINDDVMPFNEAALRFSMDKDTRSNGGLMVNHKTSSSKFEISDIPAEMNKAIQGLKPGEMTAPFRMMDDRKGKETYRMVLLKKKTAPHKANIGDDYQLLQSMMENKKRQEALNKWIKAKQGETYITIDKNWVNCDFRYEGWIKN